MADDMQQEVILDAADEVSLGPTRGKQRKLPWQETLVNLVAAQQKQLDELTRQSNAATLPWPTPSTSGAASITAPASMSTSFHLTSYDPDGSAYSIQEWLEDATRLTGELNVSDIVMIAKAGEALRRRGYKYYCDWRPLNRTWDNFCDDLVTAFPEKETPGARCYIAANLRSLDCESLCDYGNRKLRAIQRFYDGLPWSTILSIVEYGLNHGEARSAIRVQKPTTERELLTLLSEFHAHWPSAATVRVEAASAPGRKTDRWSKERRTSGHTRSTRRFSTDLKGACYKCGARGHLHSACPRHEKQSEEVKRSQPDSSAVSTCDYCKKMGHSESACWYKRGRRKKALLLKK